MSEPWPKFRLAAALAWGILAVGGCARAPLDTRAPLDEATRRALYERADRVFDEGDLWSPVDSPDGGAVLEMAPLLVLEVGAERTPPGDVLEVRTFASQVELRGDVCAQRTYYWRHSGAAGGTAIQGLRMTFGADGFPWIYEVLGDSSGVRPLFVATALEAAAAAEFDGPLPGRSFAVERAVAEATDVIVAGVLEPGPVPLGPFVYMTADGGDVSSVICRCMPSQVGAIAGNGSYRLIRLPGSEEAAPEARPAAAPLERMIRIPAFFRCR